MPLLGSKDYLSTRTEVLLQDDYGRWINLNSDFDFIENSTVVDKIPGLSIEKENDGGLINRFITQITSITLDNTDGWLDGADFSPKFVNDIPARNIDIHRRNSDYSLTLASGTSNYLSIPHTDSLNPNAFFTVEFWVYLTAYPSGQLGAIMSKSNGSSNGFFLEINPSGQLLGNLYHSSSSNIATGTSNPLPLNVWNHVVMTWSAVRDIGSDEYTHNLRIYINGSFDTGVTSRQTGKLELPTADLLLNKRPLTTGACGISYDEFRYYSRALTYAEISSRYNNGIGIYGESDKGLICGFRFAEGTGTTTVSYGGSQTYTGTVTGSSSWSGGHIPSQTLNNIEVTKNSQRYYFKLSRSGMSKTWKNRKVKFIQKTLRTDQTFDIDELGVFYITNTKNKKNKKIFNLESISSRLDNTPADKITNAGNWYENVSYRFLIQKLLSTTLDTNGGVQIVDKHIIPNLIEKPTSNNILKMSGKLNKLLDWRNFSVLGRPPEFTEGDENGIFVNSKGVVTAMEIFGESGVGTVSGNTLIGNGVTWTGGTTIRPVAGDAVYINDPNGLNTGYYEIESIASDTTITLKTPVKGSSNIRKSNTISFSFVKIYMAIQKSETTSNEIELWKYIPGLDKYVRLIDNTTFDTAITGTPPKYSIKQLKVAYYAVTGFADDDRRLFGMAFSNPLEGNASYPLPDDRRCQHGFLFSFTCTNGEISGVTNTDLTLTISSNSHEPTTGLFHYRHGHSWMSNIYRRRVGQDINEFSNAVIGGEMISIPFEQNIGEINIYDDAAPTRRFTRIERAYDKKYPNWIYGSSSYQGGDIRDGDEIFQDYWTEHQFHNFDFVNVDSNYYLKLFKVTPGYHSYDVIGSSNVASLFTMRYTSGQKGAFALRVGKTDSTSTGRRDEQYYYYILSQQSYDNTITMEDSTYQLVSDASITRPTPITADYQQFSIFFKLGVKYYYDSGNTLKLQPTYIEAPDNKYDVFISFVAWDDVNNDDQTYPWVTKTFSCVYRIYDDVQDRNESLDTMTTFLGTASFLTTSTFTPGSSTSFTAGVSDVAKLRVGDVIRIDKVTDSSNYFMAYAIISDITGTTVTVRDNTGTLGCNRTIVGSPTYGNSRINVVARQVFFSDANVNSTFGYCVPLETKILYLRSGDYETGGGSSGWDDSSDDKDFLMISCYNRNKCETPEQYTIGYVDARERNTSLLHSKYFINQPEGLLVDKLNINSDLNTSTLTLRGWYFFVGGLLFSTTYDATFSSTNLQLHGNGFIPVDDELWLACPPVLDTYTRAETESNITDTSCGIIYGISSPKPFFESQDNIPNGKYYLFKYDSYLAMRIPLAQFEGLSIWQALTYMAQKADYLMGFVGDTFWFIPRSHVGEFNTEPEFVLRLDDGDDEEADSFEIEEIDFSEEDIINHIKVVPNKIVLKEPEVSFVFKPRGKFDENGLLKEEYSPNVEINVQQIDTKKKSIRLSCVKGGFISQGVYLQETKDAATPVKFRYLISEKSWETTNTTSFPYNTTTIDLAGDVDDIKQGDVLEVYYQEESGTDTTENQVYIGTYIVLLTPEGEPNVQGRLYVVLVDWNEQPNNNIPIGTKIIVRPDNKWSDYNRNLLRNGDFELWNTGNQGWTTPLDWEITTDNVSVPPTVVKKSDNPYTGSNYLQVDVPIGSTGTISQDISVNTSKTYYISAFVRGRNVTINTLNGVIAYSRGSGERINYNEWYEISGSFVSASSTETISVIFDEFCDIDSIIVTAEPYIQRNYLSIGAHDISYEIGKSGVFIKFSDENKGNYSSSDKQETKFQYGDLIDINCDGLSIEKANESTQVVRDETSIGLYGETTEEMSNNPFLGLLDAKDIGQQIIFDKAHPKRAVSVISKARPGLTFINIEERRMVDRIDIYSRKDFPHDPGYTLKGKIIGLEYIGGQRMRIKVRALNPN